MALLGTFIDQRTIAAILAAGSASFAHGLPAAPDTCIAEEVTTAGSNVSAIKLVCIKDATNVSVYNHGEGASQALRITSILFHSITR